MSSFAPLAHGRCEVNHTIRGAGRETEDAAIRLLRQLQGHRAEVATERIGAVPDAGVEERLSVGGAGNGTSSVIGAFVDWTA